MLCKAKNENDDVHLTSEIFYRTLDVSIEDDQMFNVFKDNIKYYPLNTEFTPKHITWKGYLSILLFFTINLFWGFG